jgi:lysozyme
MSKARIAIAALSLSAAALIGLVTHENYTGGAVIPTKNDRPTVGFGSTFHEDGTPVKMGDTTTPVRALIKAQAHISKEEDIFRKSLPNVELYQQEYDTFMDWTYQYGTGAWIGSEMQQDLLAGDYVGACEALLSYKYLTSGRATKGWEPYKFDKRGAPLRWRFDCSTPGNKVCMGVWTRQLERHKQCMEAQ